MTESLSPTKKILQDPSLREEVKAGAIETLQLTWLAAGVSVEDILNLSEEASQENHNNTIIETATELSSGDPTQPELLANDTQRVLTAIELANWKNELKQLFPNGQTGAHSGITVEVPCYPSTQIPIFTKQTFPEAPQGLHPITKRTFRHRKNP